VGDFKREVGRFVDKFEKRTEYATKQATQAVIHEAQAPFPGKSGGATADFARFSSNKARGRMPVVTGFLRASIRAAVDRMPSGPRSGDKDKDYSGDALSQSVTSALLRWDSNSGDALYVGWSAVYARAMEYRYGFMRGAAENWDKHVREAVRDAIRRWPPS